MRNSRTVIFQAKNLPVLQNRLYTTEAEAVSCPTGDVLLKPDPRTSIISNEAFDSKRVVYDQHYNNEQGASVAFKAHLEGIADLIERHFGEPDLIEVGCGKGVFLDCLRRRGFELTGLDPAYEGDDPMILKQLFTEGLGLRANGIILRHVLEHVQNPVSFLHAISAANDGKGLIYIEVPCFDWICKNRAWFDIFYEHVNYFRLEDFSRIFGRLLHAERTFGGQYLSIIGDLETLSEAFVSCVQPPVPSDLMEGAGKVSETMREWKEHRSGLNVVWGAGSKGVIFNLHMSRRNAPVDYVVDINPDKAGKFLPCTGIRVSSPEEFNREVRSGSRIFVMNPNYLEEVQALTGNRHEYLCA